MQNDVGGLVPLHALPGVVEELVQGGALALLQRVVVEDLVGGQAGVPRLDPGLHQQVLRVQHLGHGETVAEPLVHRGQGVLDRARWFQPLGLELSPGKLQRLGEELQTTHVEKQLLDSPLKGSVILLTCGQPSSLGEARQRRCLAPGHTNNRVHQHRDEPELGEHLVMFRGQESLLRQVRGRQRTARVLVLLVKAA